MRGITKKSFTLNKRSIDYRLIESSKAKHLRVRIRATGVEVLKPTDRSKDDVQKFLRSRAPWIDSQLERVKKLNGLCKITSVPSNTIMLRGERLRLELESVKGACVNRIKVSPDALTILAGAQCRTPVDVTLENWLRGQAREEILRILPDLSRQLRRTPRKVFVMGQRTKWGNCSAKRTLSFNWRLIMAPSYVMRYLIIHEVVHLAVPDHSPKFWLTVKSYCPDAERARQWLAAHASQLLAQPLSSLRK